MTTYLVATFHVLSLVGPFALYVWGIWFGPYCLHHVVPSTVKQHITILRQCQPCIHSHFSLFCDYFPYFSKQNPSAPHSLKELTNETIPTPLNNV
jgi:hypothetical protein